MSYYVKNGKRRLISRRGPSDLSGVWDKLWSGLKGGVSSAVNFYGQAKADAGVAAAAQAQLNAQALQAQAKPGISTGTALVIGGGVLGAILLLRR